MGVGPGGRAQQALPRAPGVGCESQPGPEGLFAPPGRHVGADLGEHGQRGIHRHPINGRQINAGQAEAVRMRVEAEWMRRSIALLSGRRDRRGGVAARSTG